MKTILFYIAVIGWVLGLTVHLLSKFDINIVDKMPYVWLLHAGIFVVWIPAILTLLKNEEFKAYQKSGFQNRLNPVGFYKILFKQTPLWLTVLAVCGLVYAVINFMLFMASLHGTPGIRDGQYVLQDHGTFIKTLTEQEYNHYKALQLTGFSGHWLAFYGLAAAILFPYKKRDTIPETPYASAY